MRTAAPPAQPTAAAVPGRGSRRAHGNLSTSPSAATTRSPSYMKTTHQVCVLQVAVQHLVDLQQRQPAEQLAQVALDLRCGKGWGEAASGRVRQRGNLGMRRGMGRRCTRPGCRLHSAQQSGGCATSAAAAQGSWSHTDGPGRTWAALNLRFSRLVRSSRPVMSWSM